MLSFFKFLISLKEATATTTTTKKKTNIKKQLNKNETKQKL